MKHSSPNRYNVVLFWYMNDWGKFGRAYEKIAENLSLQENIHKVLCILPPYKIRKRYGVLPFLYNNISSKLIVLTPNIRVTPLTRISGSLKNKAKNMYFQFALQQFIKNMAFDKYNTLLWIFPPHLYIQKLIKLVPHKKIITHIVDNNIYKENESTEKIAFFKSQYDEFAKNSDIVITASKSNHDYFSLLNSNCILFENAVDKVFIGVPSNFPYLTNMRRPRIGYTGFISERTDIDLLVYIAKKRKEYDLILAGPVEIPTSEFEKLNLPNVYYEGIIPYENMPLFIENLDVCLIAHRDTQFSRSMSPLKLYQYLASGRPVVSTKVAGVDRWNGLISISENYYDFICKVDETLENDTIKQSAIRIDIAKSETWEKRVKLMTDAVFSFIDYKK